MTIKDYFDAEILRVQNRINAYCEYGYSPALEPIVKALKELKEKLVKEREKSCVMKINQ